MDLPEILERRLVIAIDYGTTSTGIAFATPAGNRANLAEIDIVTDWGRGMGNLEKVPSVISYSRRSSAQEQQWGASLSPDALAMVHTKLQLELDNTSDELDLVLEALEGMGGLDFQHVRNASSVRYTWKGPQEIVENYLSRVFDAFLPAIEARANLTQAVRAQMLTDIILTVPAGWSYRAKNSIFRALNQAGFNRLSFPRLRETLVISEPEAAAIYTSRYLKELDGADFLRKDDCFVLCDAGGGTVDVVSYRVQQVQPNFEIEPVTLAFGCKCGSIFINMAFKKWLKTVLGEQRYRALDTERITHKIGSHDAEGSQMRILMKTFNIKKEQFKKDPERRPIKMDLPPPLADLSIDNRVRSGQITIPYGDMESFFEPCINSIVDLIERQARQVEMSRRRRLKKILLVGGFAESEYLQESIGHSLELRDIQLRRPDTSWTAIVRGAAICAIEKSSSKPLVSMKPCSRSYGIAVSAPYSDLEHYGEDGVKDILTQTFMAKKQLMWLIKKGDLILSDRPIEEKRWFTMNFPKTAIKKGSVPIYAYEFEDIPDRLVNAQDELTVLHTLEYDLNDIPVQNFELRRQPGARLPFYVARLSLTMKLSCQMLEVELRLKETVLGSVNLRCENESEHIITEDY